MHKHNVQVSYGSLRGWCCLYVRLGISSNNDVITTQVDGYSIIEEPFYIRRKNIIKYSNKQKVICVQCTLYTHLI